MPPLKRASAAKPPRGSSRGRSPAPSSSSSSSSNSSVLSPRAQSLISSLGLKPHPEGGFYAQTYKAGTSVVSASGGPPRSASTAIYFLLTVGSPSRLHRLKSDEVWHFYEGRPLVVVELDEGEERKGRESKRETVLGGRGALRQHVVPAGRWFGSYVVDDDEGEGLDYALVGCTVAPGFEFADFELADRHDLEAMFPNATSLVRRLTSVVSVHPPTAPKAGRPPKKPPVLQQHPKFRHSDHEKPRQLVLSALLLLAVLFLGKMHGGGGGGDSANDGPDDVMPSEQSFRLALFTTFVVFEMFVFLQVRDLLTVWPHPGFWRLVFGAGAFYGIVLCACLALNFQGARFVFSSAIGDLGDWNTFKAEAQLEGRGSEKTCAILSLQAFNDKIVNQIFRTPWVLSHALGWMGKMMIFRDWGTCLVAGFLFEFIELIFTYVVPEFGECWWDSVFLDAFGANILGMWMGTHVNRWMAAYSHPTSTSAAPTTTTNDTEDEATVTGASVGAVLDWGGAMNRDSASDKLITLVSPLTQSTYKWKIFSSPRRLVNAMTNIFVMLFVEINTFLMMNTMGIPHNSVYNKARLALMGFLSLAGAAEWYVYVEHNERSPDTARIGPASWLVGCLSLLEFALFWKNFPHHFVLSLDKLHSTIPMPTDTLICCSLSIGFFALWFVLRFYVVGNSLEASERDIEGVVAKIGADGKKQGAKKSVGGLMRRISIFNKLPAKLQKRIVFVESVDVLLYATVFPMLYLCKYWKYR